MIEPNGQKIYLTTDDLSDVYTEHENPTDAALDVLEGEQSFIVVDGKELAIGYDSSKDVIIVETTDVSDEIARKARQLMQLFVANELYTKADIKGKNGYTPDDNYPYSVNLIDGNTYTVVSYYPTDEMFRNTVVNIWCGSGYTTAEIYVDETDSEAAIEEAVALSEKCGWTSLLHDVASVEDSMADDGHFNNETGETDAIFNETYLYVDATMEGATQPYYIYAENLRVHQNENIKIK